jgi:hypothetical protein
MGVDRWELEHRTYRPGRPRPAEVSADDLALDLPDEIPVEKDQRSRGGESNGPAPRMTRPKPGRT